MAKHSKKINNTANSKPDLKSTQNSTQSNQNAAKPGEKQDKGKKDELPNTNNLLKQMQSLAEQVNALSDAVIKNRLESKVRKLIPATALIFKYINEGVKSVSTIEIEKKTRDTLFAALNFTRAMETFSKLEFKPVTPKDYANIQMNVGAIRYMISQIGTIQINIKAYDLLSNFTTITKFIQAANKTISDIVKNTHLYLLAYISSWRLKRIVKYLTDLSVQLSQFEVKDVNKDLVILQNELTRILDIIQICAKINRLAPLARLSKRTRKIVVGVVNRVMLLLQVLGSKKTLKNVIKSNMNTKMIGIVIGQLALITISLALLGAFIVVAILPLLAVAGFITLLIFAIQLIGSRKTKKDIFDATKSIMLISLTILTLALTVILLATLGKYIADVWPALGVVGLLIVTVLGVFWLLGSRRMKEVVLDGGKTFLVISAAIALLALTVVVLVLAANLIDANWQQILKVGVMFIGVCAIAWALSASKKQIETGSKEMIYIAVAMLVLSAVTAVLVIVAHFVTAEWEGLLKVSAMLAIVVGCMVGLALVSSQIQSGEKAMRSLAVSMVIAAAAIIILAVAIIVAGDMGKLLGAAAIMTGVMMIFAVFAVAITKLGKVSLGVKAMKKIAIAVTITAGAMLVLAFAIKKAGKTSTLLEGATIMTGTMLVFAAAAVAMAAFGPIVGIGVGVMTALTAPMAIIAGVMLLIAKTSEKLTKLNINDPKQLATKMLTPLMALKDVVTWINKNIKLVSVWKAAAKMKHISRISKSLGDMSDMIQKMAILRMPEEFDKDGKVIKWRSMNTTDFENASKNIGTIVTHVIKTITEPTFVKQLENTSKKAMKNLKRVMQSTEGITHIVDTVEKLANGKVATGWKTDENGNAIAIGYTSFTDHLEKNGDLIKRNITKLINLCVNAMWDVLNNDTMKDRLDDVEDEMEDISKVMSGAIGIVDSINNSMNSDKKNIDANKYTESLKIFMDGVAKSLFSLNINEVINSNKERVPMFKSVVDIFSGVKPVNEKATKSIKTNIDATEKLLKTINKTDLSKLKYVYSLMASLTQFSKSINGNFDKLATVINEELITAIEKLEETLSGFNTSVNVTTSSGPAPTVPISFTKPPQLANDKSKEKNKAATQKIDESTLKRIQEALTKLANTVQGFGSSAAIRTTN